MYILKVAVGCMPLPCPSDMGAIRTPMHNTTGYAPARLLNGMPITVSITHLLTTTVAMAVMTMAATTDGIKVATDIVMGTAITTMADEAGMATMTIMKIMDTDAGKATWLDRIKERGCRLTASFFIKFLVLIIQPYQPRLPPSSAYPSGR